MNDKNVLIVLGGLPASGKSTYAEMLADSGIFQRVCPDLIRKALYGDENIQGDGKRVFGIAFHDMKEYGCLGENVVFDATNINRKRRTELVKEMRPYFDIIIFKWFSAPLSVCLARNAKRERQVPIDVLERMSANFDQPSIIFDEGWDYIEEIKNY
jgi:predicted kinase